MSHDALLCDLLEDPERVAYRPEVRTPEFFEDYIKHSKAKVDSNPAQGLPQLDIGLRIVTSSCQHARLWGLKAYGIRALGDPEAALALLEVAFSIARGCRPCQAYLLWRRAKVYANLRQMPSAFADADSAIELYRDWKGQPEDHDLDGNGLANALIARGDICWSMGSREKIESLIAQAVKDISEALDLADPRQHPAVFRVALFNLSVAIAETGKLENLKLADSHLRKARVLFRGPRKEVTQERARLDWVTGMVRHELGNCAPCRVREMLRRALTDFLHLRFYVEASAVVADLSKIHFPETDPILELANSVMSAVRRFSPDLAGRLQAVFDAASQEITSLSGGTWTVQAVQQALKEAIVNLRQACGSGVLACVLNWR